MPHIDNDVKLDFKDVLIRPKRSTLKSRADVDLTRQFTFRHSKKTYDGIPIIASNMDTVGTFEMAIQLAKVDFPRPRDFSRYIHLSSWKSSPRSINITQSNNGKSLPLNIKIFFK